MDEEGNVTIKGRSKNMLLGPSGQNIYPEEIEEKLNNLPFVAECIVIQQNDNKLVALIYPDFEDAYSQGMSDSDIEAAMEENRTTLNAELPAYSQISRIKSILKNSKRLRKEYQAIPLSGCKIKTDET